MGTLILTLILLQQPADWSMRAGYVSLAALASADMVLTGAALERGFEERNPLLKPFAENPVSLGLAKGALTAGAGLVAYSLHKKGKRREARIFLWTMNLVTALVVIHNFRQLSP